MSSETEVIIIGLSAVPLAINLPPLATAKKDAFVPVPPSAFKIVPAGMVNVAPSPTKTLPLIVHILSAVSVLSDEISPLRTKFPVTSIVTVATLLSSAPSLAL